MADQPVPNGLIGLTAQIVSAHVSHNTVAPERLPELIRHVYESLTRAAVGVPEAVPATPAIPIKQSVKPDGVICLDCGKSFQMLKRHLMTDHKFTPQQYREKWKLPHDYPMVAPNYAKVRSSLAKKIGLGKKGNGGGTRLQRRNGRKRKAA